MAKATRIRLKRQRGNVEQSLQDKRMVSEDVKVMQATVRENVERKL